MENSTKAALLSALVFPGAGHVFLKKYLPGGILIGVSFIVISYIVTKTTEKALSVVEQIQNGDVPLDIAAITELVSTQSTGNDIQLLNTATTAFIICWVIGIVDSYRLGRRRNKNDAVLVKDKRKN
ncbi:MAG: hypothetical protein DRQ42_09605 [Gammaproteobacteria bacterium]|nr:MAG: hypothetical protein DRQ42_09605 [Gammaproteobacteria bacterium]